MKTFLSPTKEQSKNIIRRFVMSPIFGRHRSCAGL
jgi:hypothetical protein